MLTQPAALLRDYLQALARSLGARAASLYIPASEASSATLVHGGTAAAVPELASLTAAEAACEPLLAETPAAGAVTRHPSAAPLGLLLRVPAHWLLELLPPVAPDPRQRRREQLAVAERAGRFAFVGLGLAPGHAWLAPGAAPPALAVPDAEAWPLALLAALGAQAQQSSSAVNDPVSGLPGRAGFLEALDRDLRQAHESGQPLSLLFFNPDDFAAVNERFGREAGDEVIRDVARRIRASLRISDRVSKYGGAIFAALLPETPLLEARRVAAQGLEELQEAAFLRGALRLGFSAGIATCEPGDAGIEGPLDLVRRADQALYAAKRAGGGRAVVWQEQWSADQLGNQDRLSGIFTGNIAKDYRNMALLLDTAAVIAASADFKELAEQVVERLFVSLRPERVGMFGAAAGTRRLLHGLERQVGAHPAPRKEGLDLDEPGLQLLERALREGEPQKQVEPAEGGAAGQRLRCAVPLTAGPARLGCLYLDGRTDALAMDAADLVFLKALASQLAVAADRAQLSEQDQRRQEQERRRLQAELEELRRALQEAKLVYRSPEMEALLATTRRVAPTDATVLILGESGTGKELLARTIHEVSPRHKRRLVVVDCSAIPTSLIESELFGHEKGAYTGAAQRTIGRLAEADGGTILLDEIGELPLQAQGRLLRFVQEKQMTPVGGTGSRSVDARLIASTNRDLAAEVAAGSFREDLFHRLNVVRLVIPPLRRRPDDILFLAEHFRQMYALLYRKPVSRFTPEAEALLAQATWPGNVRELQNRVMQAVILSEGEELGAAELGLPSAGDPTSALSPLREPAAVVSAVPPPAARPAGPAPASTTGAWEGLRAALAAQIATALASSTPRAFPLGSFLAEDLVLEAAAASEGVFRQAALRLGMPESTFRRQFERAQDLAESGRAGRPPAWSEVRAALAGLVRAPAAMGTLAPRVERVLLEQVLSQVPENARVRASLLGVTVPTYRRRAEEASGRASGDR